MKQFKNFIIAASVLVGAATSAQTADEIIANYHENTGGVEAWTNIKTMQMSGKAGFGPQEFPFTQTVTADGKMAIEIDLQGQKFIPQAFDGEKLWSTNFQTQKAEAAASEASANFKQEAKDQIEIFLNYKEKGYTVEKLEDATVEGAETFKLKLTKKPLTIEGKEEENVSYYYFDKENFVPIVVESVLKEGPQKGMKTETIFSDYQEAGTIYYPYSISQKFNGQVGQTIKIETIKINPEIDESIFNMPTQE